MEGKKGRGGREAEGSEGRIPPSLPITPLSLQYPLLKGVLEGQWRNGEGRGVKAGR